VSDGAIVIRRGEGQDYASPFGDVIAWIAGEGDTGDGYSLHERLAPPGARSTSHSHSRLTEAFYVIDGALEFVVGGETIVATPGTFVLVPMGVDHAWTNKTEGDARVLVLFSPSAQRAFFEELQSLPPADRGGGDAWRALTRKYGWD
jgi:quercetin dioxygenase-like cupin family protein